MSKAALVLLGCRPGLAALGGTLHFSDSPAPRSHTDLIASCSLSDFQPCPPDLDFHAWAFSPEILDCWVLPLLHPDAPGISVAEVIRTTHKAIKNGLAFAVPLQTLDPEDYK